MHWIFTKGCGLHRHCAAQFTAPSFRTDEAFQPPQEVLGLSNAQGSWDETAS
jgi:hypothetical protein